MIRITNVVKQLIILNVIVFIIVSFSPELKGMLSLFFPTSPNFRVWQPLSHMFNHNDIGHIFFNMFGLYIFGSLLESVWGEGKFLRFYLFSGIGAFIMQWAFWYFTAGPNLNYVSMLGASGAISGCLMGVAVLTPNMQVMLLFPPIPLKMKYLAIGYFCLDLFMGLGGGGNVANFAHIGGALTGLAISFYWKSRGFLHRRGN